MHYWTVLPVLIGDATQLGIFFLRLSDALDKRKIQRESQHEGHQQDPADLLKEQNRS
jgi:hypothetical protein